MVATGCGHNEHIVAAADNVCKQCFDMPVWKQSVVDKAIDQ